MRYAFQFWLRSRFIREEVLKWALCLVLALWAMTATTVALTKTQKTVLIGVSDDASYLISGSNESLRRKEVVSFVRSFVASYYEFSPSNHAEKISRAGDLMAPSLWESRRADLQRINERLKSEPLVQTAKILSIDSLDEERVEVMLQVQIAKRIETISTNLKVTLKIAPRDRSESNPWPLEILEISDVTL